MKNRIEISVQEGMQEPSWLENVVNFLDKISSELKYSNQEVSILFCNDEYIQQLNNDYRNIDSPTDVLSFESDDVYEDEEGSWTCIGDIAISLDTLPVNSKYFETSENDELKRLLIHGYLHLNGYDHGEEHIEKNVTPECEMLVLQEKILEKFKDEIIIK